MGTQFQFDLGDLSYDSLRTTARALALGYFPTWQFDNPNDVGVLALEIHLHAVEKSMWLANAFAQEFSIATAQSRKNVESHARNLGYPVAQLIPSTTTVSITFAAADHTRTIDANALVAHADGQVGSPVYFANLAPFTVPAGITTITLPVTEGLPKLANAVGVGRPFQSVALQGTSAMIDAVVVDGVEFARFANVANMSAMDNGYVVDVVDDSLVLVVFGDGVTGAIPAVGSQITIHYRLGGGTRGNLGVNCITGITSFANTDVSPWSLKVIGNAAATGGQDWESLDKIKLAAPRYRRAYDRICTLADAKVFAETISGVGRAHPFLLGRNLHVVIVPNGGGNPSSSLMSTVQQSIGPRLIMGYGVTVSGPTYISIDVTVTGVARAGLSPSDVTTAIRQCVADALNPLTRLDATRFILNFGMPLNQADVESAVRANGSLKPGFMVVASPVFPINCLPNQIPVAGTIIVNVTGGSLSATFESTLEF